MHFNQQASGHFAMQGHRRTMEDKERLLQHPRFNILNGINDGVHRSFFALYDGHAGYVAAEYCRRHVHVYLYEAMRRDNFEHPSLALRESLLQTEREFCNACRKRHLVMSSGTTAVVAYVQEDELCT
jgi:serine/threonine protein phosphatase PrpC